MSTFPADYLIISQNWSGAVRPYRARVYFGGVLSADGRTVEGGRYVGTTGGCTSPGRAKEAARVLIAADKG